MPLFGAIFGDDVIRSSITEFAFLNYLVFREKEILLDLLEKISEHVL